MSDVPKPWNGAPLPAQRRRTLGEQIVRGAKDIVRTVAPPLMATPVGRVAGMGAGLMQRATVGAAGAKIANPAWDDAAVAAWQAANKPQAMSVPEAMAATVGSTLGSGGLPTYVNYAERMHNANRNHEVKAAGLKRR